MWQQVLYNPFVLLALAIPIAYVIARVVASAWYYEKIIYHKQLLKVINEGDRVP